MDTSSQDMEYGLLGRALTHSWSPRIHSYFFDEHYALKELEPDEVAPFIRESSWRGLNVTIPYKRDAAQLADEVSPRVARLGVANTLVRRSDGTIYADNTDVLGFAWMLEDFCHRELGCAPARALAGGEALVLGSGGACQAICAAIEDEIGCTCSIISRHGSDTYETLVERHPHTRLIVNTTPVGMYPACPASPVSETQLASLPELKAVLDVVYNPTRTGICLMAERLAIPYESGLAMLVAQALFSNEQFCDRPLDRALIPKITSDLLAETSNICFIGMPGVGKTTTGKRLARSLRRPFVDMDDAFEMEHGLSAAEFIAMYGEDVFRDRESDVLASYTKQSGLVIACGGGVVTRERNYDLLRQNGHIVMMDRPIDQLSSRGRPISQAKGIEALAAERMPIYRAWATHIVSCLGSAERDAEITRSLLGL